MKKLKNWQICLIKNWESYTNNTYRQIAEFCDAPSDEAVRSFWRRNKSLFEKETLNQKWDALVEEMDNYNDRLVEAKVTSKPVQIVDVNLPKILVFDIETAPLAGYVWRLWKQNVAPSQLLHSGNYFVLSWSAKWLYSEEVLHDRLTGAEALAEDDKRIVKSIHALLDEADIIIAHWGSGFDLPMLNGRFIMTGLMPPSPVTLIDTKVHASKAFKFPSNKLDYLAQQFGVGQKVKTDWDLWENCLKGDEVALQQMDTYCQMDVKILEAVYLIMRPWIKPHPNVGLYIESDVPVCPTCGSKHLSWGQTYTTFANSYDSFQCDDCGSQGRARKNNVNKVDRDRLTLSLPK